MYDLPDTVLAALRSLRPGIIICMILLLAGLLLAFWFAARGEAVDQARQAMAREVADELYEGRESDALRAAIHGHAYARQAHGHAVSLALVGLVLLGMLAALGCKGSLATVIALCYAGAAVGHSLHWLVVGWSALGAGGLAAARADWFWLSGGSGLLLLSAVVAMMVLTAWRLLMVPLPGRDDMSTFVEL